jgi:hypothetical protein
MQSDSVESLSEKKLAVEKENTKLAVEEELILSEIEERFLRAVALNKSDEVLLCLLEEVNINVKNSFQRYSSESHFTIAPIIYLYNFIFR